MCISCFRRIGSGTVADATAFNGSDNSSNHIVHHIIPAIVTNPMAKPARRYLQDQIDLITLLAASFEIGSTLADTG